MFSFKHALLTASAATFLAAVPAVQAAPISFTIDSATFTPGAGYGVDARERPIFGPQPTLLDVVFETSSFAPQSFSLNGPGATSDAFQVGTVRFQEPDGFLGGIWAGETDQLGVTASFTFTNPLGTTANVIATGTAFIGPIGGIDLGPIGEINFDDYRLEWDPLTVLFGDGGAFRIDLDNLFFDDVGTQTQMATITLLRAPAEIPEPGTLALAGLALAGLAAAGRKRKTQA